MLPELSLEVGPLHVKIHEDLPHGNGCCLPWLAGEAQLQNAA